MREAAMARFKHYDYGQMKMLPVSFQEQILPGTFEFTLNHLIDHEIDLTVFEHRYRNDETGAPAYDPAILLKVILYAYSRGVTSSRSIERLCRENVVFMALSADSNPHFTTIAGFIARLDAEIVSVFRDVLLVCDEAGLIGRELFAIDGVKLPSNASKQWSGTRAEFNKKVEKMERAVRYLVKRHREADERSEAAPAVPAARAKQSAKMKTGKGVIQGYDGVALTDARHQVVVHAQAYGEAQEHGLLIPMLEGARETFRAFGTADVLERVALAADSGFHSEANVRYLFDTGVDGYLADTLFRKRDPRFATASRHVPTRASAPWARAQGQGLFRPRDFIYDEATKTCICPAGQFLYQNGSHCKIGGRVAVKFTGAKRVCGPCPLRAKCLRHPERTPVRQVVFFTGHTDRPETYTAKMKRKIDTEHGRYQYGRRLAVAEPVFANVCSARGLRRFSYRGRRKVNTQWLLYCLVHNIGKVQRYGNLKRRRPRTLQ